VDGSSFDLITRRLAVITTRRGGVAALLAGALGIARISTADAHRGAGQRHEKLACRNDQSECTANEQCCSGICKAKPGSGTEFRCVGKRKKKDKADHHNGGSPAPTCDHDPCSVDGDCCPGRICSVDMYTREGTCETCILEGSWGCTTVEDCCTWPAEPNTLCVPQVENRLACVVDS